MSFLKRNSKILILSFIILLVLIISSINFNRINYSLDHLKSGYYGLFNNTRESSGFKILDIEIKRHHKPYKNPNPYFTQFGNMLYLHAREGESIRSIAQKVIKYTYYYKTYKLENAISELNGITGKYLPEDMYLYVPYTLPPVVQDTMNYKKPEIVYTRGLYFTGNSLGSDNFFKMLTMFQKAGINAVVFDAKDITGEINYLSHVPEAIELNMHQKRSIDNIGRVIQILKKSGIYTIARIAVFRDHMLYSRKPEFALKSKRTGGNWNPGSNELWCDPTNKYVQDYNIQLAIELAEKGADEIQFDYIRFPTRGNLNDAAFKYHFGKMSNEAVITHFLKRAYDEISKRNSNVSIDIFGVVAWGKESDIQKTGQRVGLLSKHCDAISPMLYPSHFGDNFNGFTKPGDEPYHFIYTGCVKTDALANGKIIRPWLQAFSWRVTNYNEDYILKQIIASREAGAYGFLFWNSGNNYDTVYKALYKLISMKKQDKK
ncbi:MAG: hypothetical protein JW864_01635 [Spirochaetes bacterium]|nr:hypothetical protein [Spirochaetota bacterium]